MRRLFLRKAVESPAVEPASSVASARARPATIARGAKLSRPRRLSLSHQTWAIAQDWPRHSRVKNVVGVNSRVKDVTGEPGHKERVKVVNDVNAMKGKGVKSWVKA